MTRKAIRNLFADFGTKVQQDQLFTIQQTPTHWFPTESEFLKKFLHGKSIPKVTKFRKEKEMVERVWVKPSQLFLINEYVL